MTESRQNSGSDQTLARVLLGGFIREDEQGIPENCFKSKNAVAEDPGFEDECRRALARLLRAGTLPRDLCKNLASLIAPDDDPEAAERRLDFTFRKPGNRRDHLRSSYLVMQVAYFKRELRSDEEAIAAAADKLGLGEDRRSSPFRRSRLAEVAHTAACRRKP
jgi:hypothetical protein